MVRSRKNEIRGLLRIEDAVVVVVDAVVVVVVVVDVVAVVVVNTAVVVGTFVVARDVVNKVFVSTLFSVVSKELSLVETPVCSNIMGINSGSKVLEATESTEF